VANLVNFLALNVILFGTVIINAGKYIVINTGDSVEKLERRAEATQQKFLKRKV
jgi:hypothetical protein